MAKKGKGSASVEDILKELWKINKPAKEGTMTRGAEATVSGKTTVVEVLEEKEKGKRSVGKLRIAPKKTKTKTTKVSTRSTAGKKAWGTGLNKTKVARKPAGALILSKGMERHSVSSVKVKIPTGVKGLDSLLGGGIEDGYSFIIYGTPHCGKKPVIMQMAYSALKQKIPVVFVLTDFGAKKWKEMMIESGWNLERFKDRVYFIDAYSQQYSILKNEENVTYLQVPFPLSTLSIESTKFIETCEMVWNRKPLVVVHSISTLIQNFGESEVFSFLQFFLGKLGNENITSIHSIQAGMHSEKIETMITSMIDGVLEMRDMRIRAKGFLDIKTQDWIPYRMTSKGVVVEYKDVKEVKEMKAKPKAKKAKKKVRKAKKAKKVKKGKRSKKGRR